MSRCGDGDRVFDSKTPFEHLEEQDSLLTTSGEKEKADEAFGRSLEIIEEEIAKREEEKI